METLYIVDTHALIWFLAGDHRLGETARKILGSPDSILVIPAIVISECLFMVSRGKTNLTSEKIWAILTEYENVRLYPLDLAVLEKSETLTSVNEIHDRMIVATASVLQSEQVATVIITKDANIIQSGYIPVLW